jgi:hypothetical protein
MGTVFKSAAALTVLYVWLVAGCPTRAQSINQKPATDSNRNVVDLPFHAGHRPELSLESALKIAKAHVNDGKTDTSSYWLLQARLILYGAEKLDDKGKLLCWDFTWLNDKDGHALEVVVFMDGKPMQLPSL